MPESIVIRSMLFADVVGFSKLPDAAYPGFMREFFTDAEKVLSDPRHRALVRNTWGDAIFAVFTTPHEAARAALALQAMVKSTAWNQQFGLPEGATHLQLRIGLHAGPVHEGYDPITKSVSFMGRHTNLAARIEPIAEEGHVYVSGEFAAMATVAGENEFQFDYVGQRPLPKKAGVIPVFRLSASRPVSL
jgi:class 3 adenylate cyclase